MQVALTFDTNRAEVSQIVSTHGAPLSAAMLPVLDQPREERADAARNRRALLAAAQQLVATSGVKALSMDRVAAAAGVGVGTVYRRFGDRAGLAVALVDDRERRLQAGFMTGPPPLGPGAPAADRIRAFMHAHVDRLDAQADLLVVMEQGSPTARYDNGAYLTSRAHLVALLKEAQNPGDLLYLAEALLALLDASRFIHQHRDLGMDIDRIKVGIDQVLAEVVPKNHEDHGKKARSASPL